MNAVFPQLSAATYRRHALHDLERGWPETNCYSDLLIEILHTRGHEPLAALGMTVAQDFEGDQFTFFKIATADIQAMFGLDVEELSVYRPLVDHVEEQIARGRVVMVDVDAFHLPDTRGVSYGIDHVKTAIGINAFDRKRPLIGYFHNAGYFEMAGEEVEALLGFGSAPPPVLPPYCEILKVVAPALDGEALRAMAHQRFRDHWARRPRRNPVDAYRATLPQHLDRLLQSPPAAFHPYAFNTARQFGAAMGLLGAHLTWLATRTDERATDGDAACAATACAQLAESAKTFQFLLARAVARRRFDALDPALDAMARQYDKAMAAIATAFRLPLASAVSSSAAVA